MKKLLIVGAGVAGLAARAQLSKFAKVRVIEKAAQRSRVGSGLGLPPNAVIALSSFPNVYKYLDQKKWLINEHVYTNQAGDLLMRGDLSTLTKKYSEFWGIKRGELIHSLMSEEGALIEYGLALKNIRQLHNGCEVGFSDGSRDIFDLVIGADGVNSTLRSHIYKDVSLCDLGVDTWRILLKRPKALINPQYMLSPTNGVVMLYPVSENEVYCYGHTDSKLKSHSHFLSHLESFSGSVPDVLKENFDIGDRESIRGRIRYLPKFYPGYNRFVLIGDAAHGLTPVLQQGVAQALRDVASLTYLVKRNKNFDQLARNFYIQRHNEINFLIKRSTQVAEALTGALNPSKKSTFSFFGDVIGQRPLPTIQAWEDLLDSFYQESDFHQGLRYVT